MRELGLPEQKVNPNGGAIALGHPIGCPAARETGTLLHELARRNAASGNGQVGWGGGRARVGSCVLCVLCIGWSGMASVMAGGSGLDGTLCLFSASKPAARGS